MFDSLPVIIVTAKTRAAAAEMISEMIDDDATAETKPAGHESADRAWRLSNKYYTALVRVQARAAVDEPSAHAGPVGAHVALLARSELQPAEAERLLRPLLAAPVAPVNVLACDAVAVPDDLLALCARLRLEPVALRESAPERREPCGVQAVRAALHAHPWPGLRMRAPARDQPEEELHEELFLSALEALSGAAERTARLQGAERRAAAERLVATFAAAIGQPLEDLD